MHNAVTDFLINSLPAKRRKSQIGWLSFNAPCCHHRGESMDRKGRGGVKTSENGGVSYHCFNCKFTASYVPGRYLSYKFRKLLAWLGTSSHDIDRLVIEALRVKEQIAPEEISAAPIKLPEYSEIALPEESNSFWELVNFYTLSDQKYSQQFIDAVEYVAKRKISMKDYDFYISNSKYARMDKRIIIPFLWHGKIVGYTGRHMTDGEPKYYTQSPANFIFNLDKQKPTSKFVIVSEGPFDAMSVDGIATLGNEITDSQADLIDNLDREVIVVAHADNAGKELIKCALEYGWTMSFPIWGEHVKDINEATMRFGKLYVLKSILAARETNSLKIKLRMRGLSYA